MHKPRLAGGVCGICLGLDWVMTDCHVAVGRVDAKGGYRVIAEEQVELFLHLAWCQQESAQ